MVMASLMSAAKLLMLTRDSAPKGRIEQGGEEKEASRAESRMRERTGCLFKVPRYIFRFTLSLLLFLNSLSFLVRCPKNQQCEARSEEVFLGEKGRCWPLPHFRDSEVNIKNCHLACK